MGAAGTLTSVSEVFAAGTISYRLAALVVKRTRLVKDREARAKIDVEIAAQITGWGPLSKVKQESEIDYWVDRYDPSAVVRAETSARSRHVDVTPADDGSGVCFVEAVLFAHDGEVMDKRLDDMARGVCDADPRTLDQRRSAAMGAIMAKADRLQCLCGAQDCPAARPTHSAVVVHVIAEEASLADQTPVALDGECPPEPDSVKPLQDRTIADLLAPVPPSGPATTNPAKIVGGGLLPAPILAATLADSATIKWIVHPGACPPEIHYTPSGKLSDFVRCRDMTCRFPGCDVPAYECDLDHTIAYPVGPTLASNLACLCRKHHLLKTFWGWRDVQYPDGTVVWRSPGGQTFTTHPGSRVLFPALCRPTAPVAAAVATAAELNGRTARSAPSGLGMPRRSETRAQSRARRIDDQRRINEALLESRNDDPPF